MSGILAQRPGSEADYEAIELAVMETDRGRWFLSEYAKRNRHADTQVLLTALSRIEKSVAAHREPTQIDQFRLCAGNVESHCPHACRNRGDQAG
jgi:hypothetical protein